MGLPHQSLSVGSGKMNQMGAENYGVGVDTSISCCESSIMRVFIADASPSSEDGEVDAMTAIESWTTRSTFFLSPQDLPSDDDVRPTESIHSAPFWEVRLFKAFSRPPFDWMLLDC